MKSRAWTIAVVGIAALAAIVFSGHFLGVERSDLSWTTIVDGVLTGAVASAAWAVARSRSASGPGLVVCAVLLLASAASVEPLEAFVRAPIAWALVTALAARFVRPSDADDAAGVDRQAGAVVGHGPHGDV